MPLMAAASVCPSSPSTNPAVKIIGTAGPNSAAEWTAPAPGRYYLFCQVGQHCANVRAAAIAPYLASMMLLLLSR